METLYGSYVIDHEVLSLKLSKTWEREARLKTKKKKKRKVQLNESHYLQRTRAKLTRAGVVG